MEELYDYDEEGRPWRWDEQAQTWQLISDNGHRLAAASGRELYRHKDFTGTEDKVERMRTAFTSYPMYRFPGKRSEARRNERWVAEAITAYLIELEQNKTYLSKRVLIRELELRGTPLAERTAWDALTRLMKMERPLFVWAEK